jgi:hypothetical protein
MGAMKTGIIRGLYAYATLASSRVRIINNRQNYKLISVGEYFPAEMIHVQYQNCSHKKENGQNPERKNKIKLPVSRRFSSFKTSSLSSVTVSPLLRILVPSSIFILSSFALLLLHFF